MSPDAVARNEGDWALFIDVDGTLLKVAATAQDVHVPEEVKQQLLGMTLRLYGALALLSGRSLADIDRWFAPLRFCAAGVHGCELREPSGCVTRAPVNRSDLSAAKVQLESLLLCHEELLLEDKHHALAVHFGRAPHLQEKVHDVVSAACLALGEDFVLHAGKFAFEIRPAAWTKGTAVAALMRLAPFEARTPIYVGGDDPDDCGSAVVEELGGISIRVGEPLTAFARHRLRGVRQVIRWLEDLPPPPSSGHA